MEISTYVPLRNHSAYSLLEGAIKIPALVKIALAEGFAAVAITDSHNMFGSLEFSEACCKAGVQPIIGCVFRLMPMQEAAGASEYDELLLLAKDEIGYTHLMKLVSDSYLHPEHVNMPLISLASLAKYNEGLIALSGGVRGAIGKAILRGKIDTAYEFAKELGGVFAGRFYVEIMRHGLREEAQTEPHFLQIAKELNLPIIATNDAYFYGEEMYEAHDALICIAEGRYVVEDNRRRLTPEHRLKSHKEICALFADLPEALENTHIVASRCAVRSPSRKPMLPSYHMEENGIVLSEAEALRKAAREGLDKRLEVIIATPHASAAGKALASAALTREESNPLAKPYYDRLEYELDVIINMGFPGYFLIVSDFITWSKQQGIPVGPGRGSGAASVVAWSLLITDLDPLAHDLVFERFLNPERVSMPDFDIDFCQERRDEVINYVQNKYGADRVAQIITFGKLQARAVLRDVGRVLQMPYGQVDRICKLVPNNPANPVTLAQAIELEPLLKAQMEEDESVRKLVDISLKLEGLYRHASTHAAGVVIADRPLNQLVPLYSDGKSSMPVVQYSMKYAEEAGLVKFDFLGLKTLSVLAKAVKMVNVSPPQPSSLQLEYLPINDEPTYELLRAGNGVGVFQFESVGMRETLKKLRPDRLEDLIALGALYRPGPMDNIPTYIACKHGKEQPNYLHPSLEGVLKETYGVIIYQEQVQKIAQILSGYTLGSADLLRRAMGKKIKAEMDAQRKIFVDGAKNNNVPSNQANEIFDLVAKFAGYGFNKAHAAAYGLIGYQTAYLKANHPYEFIAASMSYDMHNTDKLNLFKQDAASMNIRILPPDINTSEADFTVQSDVSGKYIRYALSALKNVGEQAMQDLVKERKKGGNFASIYDVMQRLDTKIINKRSLENLVMAGAFDSIHPNRAQLFASIEMMINYGQQQAEERNSAQISLFGEETGGAIPPPELAPTPDWEAVERLGREYQAVGFYLSAHPLDGYKFALKQMRVKAAEELPELLGEQYRKLTMAGIVMGRKFKNSQRGRFAFVQLSDATGVYEATIYDEKLMDSCRPLLELGKMLLLEVEGKSGEDGGVRIIIQSITLLEDALKAKSTSTSINNVTLVINHPEAVLRLKEMLPSPTNAGAKIQLRIPLSDARHALMNLSANYNLNHENIVQLSQINGINLWQEK
jgi:DNA polymerase-3 subunit alpha